MKKVGNSKKDLEHRISLDERKRVLCQQNGVALLEIFEIGSETPIELLGSLIAEQLENSGVSVSDGLAKCKPDYSSCYKVSDSELLEKYALIAIRQGGSLIYNFTNRHWLARGS